MWLKALRKLHPKLKNLLILRKKRRKRSWLL
jgi:hypothetical protein